MRIVSSCYWSLDLLYLDVGLEFEIMVEGEASVVVVVVVADRCNEVGVACFGCTQLAVR